MANAQSAQNNDWMKSQQQYWDSWFEQQRNFFGTQQKQASGAPHEPWTAFFSEWQKALSGTQGIPDTAAFAQHFAKAGETYMNMMQQFYQGTGQAKPLDQMTREWTETLQKYFSGAIQPGKDPFSAMDPLGFFASMPGIGYFREKQEQMNHLYQEWAEYERKTKDYTSGMNKVGLEAVRKFQEYVANPPQGQAPLKSLKEVYAKWVDICEEIYAKYAMTEEYTQHYGEVVNALMAFKKEQNKVMDGILDQFNVPTRQEVDSLHERLHAVRRDNIQLKKDIEALKKALRPAAAKAAPAAKTSKTAKKGKK